jgi:hypothetical protein
VSMTRRPAASPWVGLTLLVADGKSSNGSRRSHPSRRRRRKNYRWSSLTIQRSPQPDEILKNKHHSHKPLDDAAEMGLKPRRPYCTRRRRHHLSVAPTNLDPKNKERSPQNKGGALPPTRAEIRHASMAQRPQRHGTLSLLLMLPSYKGFFNHILGMETLIWESIA